RLAVLLGLLDRLLDLSDQHFVALGDQGTGAEHTLLVRQEAERESHRLLGHNLRHQASPSWMSAKSFFAEWIASAGGRGSLSGARDRRPSLMTRKSPSTSWSLSGPPTNLSSRPSVATLDTETISGSYPAPTNRSIAFSASVMDRRPPLLTTLYPGTEPSSSYARLSAASSTWAAHFFRPDTRE